MNANAAFVFWLTLSGVLSSRSAHRILSHGRSVPTGARFALMSGFSEFEAIRNRAGGVEFQALLPLASGGADPASDPSMTSFFPAPQKHRGRKMPAKRLDTKGEGSPEYVPGTAERDGLAGGVTGEGVRASGASSAPQSGVVIGKGERQDRRCSHGLVPCQAPTAKFFPVL